MSNYKMKGSTFYGKTVKLGGEDVKSPLKDTDPVFKGKTYDTVEVKDKKDKHEFRDLTDEERSKKKISRYSKDHDTSGTKTVVNVNKTTGKETTGNVIVDKEKHERKKKMDQELYDYNRAGGDKKNRPYGGNVKEFLREENNRRIHEENRKAIALRNKNKEE